VIVEIKALDQLSGSEESQIINYLKATGFEVGLLVNFGSKSLEYKRFIYNNKSA
jgi:GxxExxY protein